MPEVSEPMTPHAEPEDGTPEVSQTEAFRLARSREPAPGEPEAAGSFDLEGLESCEEDPQDSWAEFLSGC